MARWLTMAALSAKDWEPLMGARWRQRGGRIQVEGPGTGFGGRSLCLSHKTVPERPYEVAVSVRLDDEAGAAGIVFEADGKDAHYGFYPTAGQLRLTRFEGPSVLSWTILRTTNSAHYRPGEWNDLRVRVEEERLLCYVNDQLVIESTDRGLTSGKAGLAKFRNTQAEFKDFEVGTRVDRRLAAPSGLQTKVAGSAFGESGAEAVEELVAEHGEAVFPALTEEAGRLERRAAQLRTLAASARQQTVERELVKLMNTPEDEIDLFQAALLVSKLDNPELIVGPYQQQLESMANDVRGALPNKANNEQRLKRLIAYLFSENGFHGSRSDYYHRANSYMDRVLDDREGLPITLAILFLELARQTGVEHVSAAPLPGHFMVAYQPARGERRFIDVFDGGKMLSAVEAERVVAEASGVSIKANEVEPATKREIIVRILRNLANVAERAGMANESVRYLDVVVALAPDAPLERLGRAMARLAASDIEGARADLRAVIDAEPAGVDLQRIEDLYRKLQRTGE